LVSIERKHKHKLNTITVLDQEKIMANDDLHVLNLKEKDIEIRVSVFVDISALISSLTHQFVVRPLLIRMKSKSVRILSCTKSSKYQRIRSTHKCLPLKIKSIPNSYPTSIKTSMINCVNQMKR